MSEFDFHEQFAIDFADFKSKFVAKTNDDDKLKLVHEFARKYFNFTLELKKSLSNISKWSELKKKYRDTDDIAEKLTLLENFIYSSFICENNECPIFQPLGQLNLDLDFMVYTSKQAAIDAMNIDAVEYRQWQKIYDAKLTKLNSIMKAVYQMYVVRNTTRFEKASRQKLFQNSLLYAKESKDEGMITMSNAGPFESEMTNQFDDVFERKPEVKQKTETKNERLPKAEENQKYLEEGKFNQERIRKELGENLEVIKNKKKLQKED